MALPDKDLAILSTFVPFGPARIALLVKYFGSPAKVWTASEKRLLQTGLNPKLVTAFNTHRKAFDSKAFFDKLSAIGATFTTLGASDYPANLAQLTDVPTTLYIRGKVLPQDENAVAIVGSRKITTYGKEVTTQFATQLAGYGVTIVSGLAFGVDRYAHESALLAGGRCIAVLASGIDEITPHSNEWLGKKILSAGGAILSEFPPGTLVQKSYFPHRNRIISGLSKAIVVVEGAEQSGTLHTAKHAADQGKEVFAVPGQISSPLSAAPHMLIRNGAKIAFSPRDVLVELDVQLKVDRASVQQVLPDTSEEAKLLTVLAGEPLYLDELARILGVAVSLVSQNLTTLELKGLVKNVGGGKYAKV